MRWMRLALVTVLAQLLLQLWPATTSRAQAPQPEAASDAGVVLQIEDAPPTAAEAATEQELVELQENEPQAVPAAVDDDGTLVVTGSRIKRSAELASSAPVDILDHRALERTGAAYAGDLMMASQRHKALAFKAQATRTIKVGARAARSA